MYSALSHTYMRRKIASFYLKAVTGRTRLSKHEITLKISNPPPH